MAILQQHPTATTRYFGWYGKCDSTEDCAPFPLLIGAGFSWAHTIGLNPATGKSDIFKRVEIMTNPITNPFQVLPYDGQASNPMALAFGSPLRQLECGHIYQIDLMPGTGSVDIPHLVAVSAADDSAGYVTTSCETSIVYPTATPLPTPTATPIASETGEVSCCPDDHFEILTTGTGTSVTSEQGITVQGLHAGGKLCTAAPAGGLPDHFEVIHLGQSVGIITVPRIPDGTIMQGNDLTVYYLYNDNCYSGDLDDQNNRLSLELV